MKKLKCCKKAIAQQRFASMATSGFSYGKSAAEWNVFVIFVMTWCWCNATESKPQNVTGKQFSEVNQNTI